MICFGLMIKSSAGVDTGLDWTRMQDVDAYLAAPELVAKYPHLTAERQEEQGGVTTTVAYVDLAKAGSPAVENAVRRDVRDLMTTRILTSHLEFVVTEGGSRRLDLAAMAEKAPQALEALRAQTRSRIEDSGKAFPMMVINVLPVGVRGIVVAGLLAALMSSLAGVFAASATLFTMDLYVKWRPATSQRRLVWIGRVATAIMALIGIAWIPVIQGSRGLYHYLQSIQGYLAPPIFVVFFLGVFWKRLNGPGCLAALITGFAMGLFRMAVDTPAKVVEGFAYDEGTFLWIVHKMYFQYYSLIVFLVCCAVMIGVSYLTKAPDYARISGLTYGTVTDEHREESRGSFGAKDIVWSFVVLACIAVAYLYFNG
ncbi:MAG: hypothetical protein H6834_05015 [Planctomycetes bacterium]|nr:hypothetical protein [Planctomycetota bacterium]